MKKVKKLFELFWLFFKVGLFTFGGGYAMISVLENEIIERKKWLNKDEFIDIIAIAESTPGPVAINTATYVGYKKQKFWGAFFATLGFVLPSFIIILVLSIFIDKFNLLEIEYVKYAFMGINSCVAFLIINAGIKLFVKQKKNIFNCILCFITIVLFVLFTIFEIHFSSIYFIIIGGLIGILSFWLPFLIRNIKKGGK